MKSKLLIIALIAFAAISAPAISFSWAATGIKFDGTTLKKSTDVTGYLIYLGSGAELASPYSLTSDSTADSISGSIGTKFSTSTTATTNAGKLSSTASFDFGDYTNGDTFAMLLAYTSGGKTYYNLSSTVYELTGIADERSTPGDANFTFSYDTVGESNKLSSGSGWTVAVPEPSTAALALAGLALLLKRRKA